MQALRLAAPALALAAILSSIFLFLGFSTGARTIGEGPYLSPYDEPLTGTLSDPAPRDAPEGKALSASMPAKDVRGEPIPVLPRYPGSVRVAYSDSRAEGLVVVRARYLSEKPPGAVRDYYDGVFRSGGWRLANVEYSDGAWFFLGVRGEREAGVEVSPRGGGSTVGVEFSRPPAGDQEDRASAAGSKR